MKNLIIIIGTVLLGVIIVNIDRYCNKLTIWCVAGTKFSVATNS